MLIFRTYVFLYSLNGWKGYLVYGSICVTC